MNYEMLDRLTAAHCQLRESAKEIEKMAMYCYPGASALEKCEKERIRQQERANKYALSLHALLLSAEAVCDRWDIQLWKGPPHTGDYISALRKAIDEAKK